MATPNPHNVAHHHTVNVHHHHTNHKHNGHGAHQPTHVGNHEHEEEEEEEEEVEVGAKAKRLFEKPVILKSKALEEGKKEDERSLTWSELFFDLVFATVIAALGDTLQDLKIPIRLYGLLMWTLITFWKEVTFYACRFNSDDFMHRMYFSFLMLAIVSVGAHLKTKDFNFGDDSFKPLAYSFFAVTTALWLIKLRLSIFFWDHEKFHSLHVGLVLGVLSSGFYLVSALSTCETTREGLWWGAIGLRWAMMLYPAYVQSLLRDVIANCSSKEKAQRIIPSGGLPMHTGHFNERIGCFMLIVLGETVNGVVVGPPSSVRLQRFTYLAQVSAFSLAVMFKALYFDIEDMDMRWHAMRSSRFRAMLWNLAGEPMIGAVAVFGSACAMLVNALATWDDPITDPSDMEERAKKLSDARLYFCGSVSIAFGCQAICQAAHKMHFEQLVVGHRPDAWKARATHRMRVVYWCRITLQLGVSIVIGLWPVYGPWNETVPSDEPPPSEVVLMLLVVCGLLMVVVIFGTCSNRMQAWFHIESLKAKKIKKKWGTVFNTVVTKKQVAGAQWNSLMVSAKAKSLEKSNAPSLDQHTPDDNPEQQHHHQQQQQQQQHQQQHQHQHQHQQQHQQQKSPQQQKLPKISFLQAVLASAKNDNNDDNNSNSSTSNNNNSTTNNTTSRVSEKSPLLLNIQDE